MTTSTLQAGSGFGYTDVAFVDYDHDSVDEILLAHDEHDTVRLTAYDIAASNVEAQLSLDVATVAHQKFARMVPADINEDGFPDMIAFTVDGYIDVFDVRNQTLLWRSSDATTTAANVDAGDLDGDGKIEIIAASRTTLFVFGHGTQPNTFVKRAEYGYQPDYGLITDVLVADTDGNGTPEIYTLNTVDGVSMSVHRFDAQLAEQSSFKPDGVVYGLALEDIGNSRKNLLLLGKRLRSVDAINGAVVWASPDLPGSVQRESIHYVDLNGDGRKELSLGGIGMSVTR